MTEEYGHDYDKFEEFGQLLSKAEKLYEELKALKHREFIGEATVRAVADANEKMFLAVGAFYHLQRVCDQHAG
jgi:DNA-binding Lrp family transcriptional regulator